MNKAKEKVLRRMKRGAADFLIARGMWAPRAHMVKRLPLWAVFVALFDAMLVSLGLRGGFRIPPMPASGGSVIDAYEVLATDIDFSAGASGGSAVLGTELSVLTTGNGVGLMLGVVYEALMTIQGLVTGTSPTLQVFIRAKDEDGAFFNIAVFPTITSTSTDPFPDENIESGQYELRCYFVVPRKTAETLTGTKDVVAIDAYGTTTGTSTPTYNDVNIRLRPALDTGSIS